MTDGAMEALRADREVLLDLCSGLSADDWMAPSGCAGWSVTDVVAHVGNLFWMVVDPAKLPDTTGLESERAQDVLVAARRGWSPDEVLADYKSVSADAIEVLAGLAIQDFEIPLGDLGTYPASLVPNAFSFDHFVHIRADLFSPRGPLTDTPPPVDELRLVPALDWIEAALPQQNPGAVPAVEIVLTGVAARTIRLGQAEPSARITSDAPAFVRWVTQRGTWDELGVEVSGDEWQLETARHLHVY